VFVDNHSRWRGRGRREIVKGDMVGKREGDSNGKPMFKNNDCS
jgi:hypothetical protein